MSELWKIVYTKDALKDKKIAFEAGFGTKIDQLLELVEINPFQKYPPYEKLLGDMSGAYSRRINVQHRFVYSVYLEERIIKVISLWSHYE